MSRAILWDFDGTLAERPGMWRACLCDVLEQHEPNHHVAPEALTPFLRDGFPWHTPDVSHPQLSDPDVWWEHAQSLLVRAFEGVGFGADRARELGRHARASYVDITKWRLFDDTVAVLSELKASGWRHVILSNHVPELAELVERVGLGGLIDEVVNSAVTGYEKPHPEAFSLGRAAGRDAHELWMIGDNPVADVAGAEAVGIPAILVRRIAENPNTIARQSRDLTGVLRWL
jgi:putative hydrolase of the HAD superfamily